MLVEIKVPQLSESVAEATLLSWKKKEGEHVDRDENLIDIETDKVVLELPSPATGVLTKIIKDDGATVTSGEVIASIDTEATAEPSASGKEPAPARSAPESAPEAAEPEKPARPESKAKPGSLPEPEAQRKPGEETKPVPEPTVIPPAGGAISAMMPAARSAAAKANLEAGEAHSIKGTGRGDRITK